MGRCLFLRKTHFFVGHIDLWIGGGRGVALHKGKQNRKQRACGECFEYPAETHGKGFVVGWV